MIRSSGIVVAGHAICLCWLVLAIPAGAEEVAIVEVTGESPSIYSRPAIAERYLVGHARSGESYPFLATLDTGLPQPFFRILYRSHPAWIYGNSARRSTAASEMLTKSQLIAIARFQRDPDEAVGGPVRDMLRSYNAQRQELESDYGFDDFPALNLVAENPVRLDLIENVLIIELEIAGGDGRLKLPRSERFLFQMLVAIVFDEREDVETCRLVFHRDRDPEAVIEIPRQRWENALDLSPDAFWNLVDKVTAEELWEVP